jgi:hypothetical protein
VPGEVCGRPLDFLGVPSRESKREEDWRVGLPPIPYLLDFFPLKNSNVSKQLLSLRKIYFKKVVKTLINGKPVSPTITRM